MPDDEYRPPSDHLMTDIVLGGECRFCENECDGVIEEGVFRALVYWEDKEGARHPVCEQHWGIMLDNIDPSLIMFNRGFCVVRA